MLLGTSCCIFFVREGVKTFFHAVRETEKGRLFYGETALVETVMQGTKINPIGRKKEMMMIRTCKRKPIRRKGVSHTYILKKQVIIISLSERLFGN